ncbi:type II secretion system F family protein [Jiella sp. MQZ9-1]|uniref:Type II secretion system F family protein n=1 Tax=Jiella flava TaxID=2816857 RepID=A0A939G255_9HYPH|nr:type II secretion system F family protein [Jiella flava]MBO0663689.1 type II secretion system F family protein [Jiella flava]MCD2472262.1 type II secretion system F family protein [Jiella flava]
MQDVFQTLGLSSQFVLSAIVAIGVFTTLLAIAVPILAGNKLKSRMKAVALERDQIRARERARLASEKERGRGLRQEHNRGFAGMVVERLNLRSALVDDKTVANLRAAGYRGQRPLTMFLFARVTIPLVFFAIAAFYIFGLGLLASWPFPVRLLVFLIAGYLGFYIPVILVNNTAQKRRQSIMQAWPDALDLLLICVESGSSIEAAFRRVAEEVGIQSIPLAEELTLLTAELSFLPDRKQAYDNLSSRTGLEGVKAVCTALIQAERYGTPISQALRVMAQENRDIRMNAAEKKAAALPPKLTVPMIVFFLPVLFVVILGPAVIRVFGLE